jgi:uroporphyrinogen decarboxylase
MYRNVPVKNPKPDARKFIDILMGRSKSDETPLVEFLIKDEVAKPIVTQMLGRHWVDSEQDRASQSAYLDNRIALWHHMGYDFIRVERNLGFTVNFLDDGKKKWVDPQRGIIENWAEFDSYPWPTPKEIDYFPFEYINNHLPEGMGLIVSHMGGILEYFTNLMTYEKFCLALYDAPDLVQTIVDKVGELMSAFYRHLTQLDNVIAVFPGDDMGFRSGTLIAPDMVRKYALPWHKHFAAIAHERNMPYFLHSCGNIEKIMEDLIEDVGIDAKHSFEDNIIPVQDFQARYGNRIAVLGGIDLDILAAGTPEQVRQKTRSLIETCGSRGRYAIGSGNSIPDYVPVDNYLAMIDEALTVNGEK